MADTTPSTDHVSIELRSIKDNVDLETVPTRNEGVIIDPVFGEIDGNGPNYRNIGWIRASVLMMKAQIGIGGLAVPQAFATLGLIPGFIVLTLLALITTWSGHVIGRFKLNHPDVYGLEDAGRLMFGPVGYWAFLTAYLLYYIFVSGAATTGMATGLNVLTDHGTCDWTFILVAAFCGASLASIRTLSRLSWLAWIGLVSIIVSIFVLMVAVGVQGRPADAPQNGPWTSDFKLFGTPDFPSAMSAIVALAFSFSGTSGFFPIVAEMRDQKKYFKAMYLCQGVMTVVYLVIGIVVTYFCGSKVASPALGSAGEIYKKICYGLAMPGLLITLMIVLHLPAKSIFVHLLRGSRHLTSNTKTHWMVWFGCIFSVTLIAYLIASAVPKFESLVSLVGALLGVFVCIQPYGMMRLYDNWKCRFLAGRGQWWTFWTSWSVFVILTGSFITAAGSYAAFQSIISMYQESETVAWACQGSLEL